MKGILISIILICANWYVTAATELNKKEVCKSEGFECTSNKDCCSEFCDKDPNDATGVCKRACGTTVSDLVQSTKRPIKFGDFPWTAGIYEYNTKWHERGKYSQFCTGTLISHTTVISAATCFVLENQITVNGLYRTEKIYKKRLPAIKIALGKYSRSFNASEDDLAQIFDVKSVEFSPGFEKKLYDSSDLSSTEYEELNYPYFSDEIVIVTLKMEVEYTRAVRPVCVDIGPYNFEKNTLVNGATGKMSCWEENQTLTIAEMNYVPRNECGNKITSSYYGFLSAQKICVEKTASHKCVYPVGGGLVFQDPKTKTYYLRGINTVAHGLTGTVPFTKLSSRRDLVEKNLDDCKRVCRRTCGVSSKSGHSCAKGSQIKPGEFPWNAGIYMFNGTLGYYDLLCGGTLISHKVVITAAHCFKTTDSYRSKIYVKELSTLKVALGKHHRDLNAPQDVLAQIVDIEHIEYSPEFIRMEANDIAVVTLKKGVTFTKAVQPICIDTDPERFEREQLVKGAVGKIVGWEVKRPEYDDPPIIELGGEVITKPGYDINSTPVSEEVRNKIQSELRDTPTLEEVQIVPIEECVAGELQYISKDVICGNKSKPIISYAACKNYLGRGLVFLDPKTDKYYLRGVASLTGFVCVETNYFPYTKLSFHKDLLEKYMDDCEGGCRRNLCEPLISKKLHIICLSHNGQTTRCDKPLPSNSKAIFTCNSLSYMEIERSKYNMINCKNGKWDRPLMDDFCVPAYAECGKPTSVTTHQPVVKNGKETKYGDFPWHAGIYEFNHRSGSFEQVCGGTLISHKVVVSAAHCFEKEIASRKLVKKELSTLKIGLGKYRRTLNASTDGLAQIVDVESIEIPMEYLSNMAQWASDIAFVTLKTQVEYTRAVIPVCIDVGPNNFEKDQLIKGAVGNIVGWGLTAENKASETLILAEMPFVPRDECRTVISHGLVAYLRSDKICAGDKSSNVTVCEGDSGGGLVFEDPDSKAYYLRGIVSLGPKGCKRPDVALFTKLSSHKELLEKYLRLS